MSCSGVYIVMEKLWPTITPHYTIQKSSHVGGHWTRWRVIFLTMFLSSVVTQQLTSDNLSYKQVNNNMAAQCGRTFLLLNSDGNNLLTEDATCRRWLTALVTLYCIVILLLTSDRQILRTQLSTDALQHERFIRLAATVSNLCIQCNHSFTSYAGQGLTKRWPQRSVQPCSLNSAGRSQTSMLF